MGNRGRVIDSIVENLFLALPLIHKKLVKIDLENVIRHVSLPHFVIMHLLDQTGPLPVSQIAGKLFITRPQMTALIDRLVELGMADRIPDTTDRRIINVKLTGKGRETLEACKSLIKGNTRKKLTSLGDQELTKLSEALEVLREIGSKLE